MLEFLKNEANLTYTENGALTNSTSGSACLDLFFEAGASRNMQEIDIGRMVLRAYAEDPVSALKIIFYARDIRGGLGERRFFRTAVKTLAAFAPEAVKRNIHNFAEYGRFDDLCVLLGTRCEKAAAAEICSQLEKDTAAMQSGGQVSLLAKWLPSVNASSAETKAQGRHLAHKLGMSEKQYRLTLSALRKYIDIIENRLRVSDYSFDYEKQPSGALFKYRAAFIRNDNKRYSEYLDAVMGGRAKMNTSTLYPYEIVRRCFGSDDTQESRKSLDAAWKNLSEYGSDENAIAVIDGSGSMTCAWNSVRPIDAALSLGIYFAEHNRGSFADHFITFSEHPQLVRVKGDDIVDKVRYCASYNEVANTNIEAVFDLILRTAVKNGLPQSEMPARLYIISDMEFDFCVKGGNKLTMYAEMSRRYEQNGYTLPEVIFWNVNGRAGNVPVGRHQSGAALVSGFTPAVFDMVMGGNISPEKIMRDVIGSERYAAVS